MKLLIMQIISVPDRKNAVSEIWLENNQVAEISSEKLGKFVIEIYAPQIGMAWPFDLDAFQLIVSGARDSLKRV